MMKSLLSNSRLWRLSIYHIGMPSSTSLADLHNKIQSKLTHYGGLIHHDPLRPDSPRWRHRRLRQRGTPLHFYSMVVIGVSIAGYVKRGSATNERAVVGHLFIIISFNTCCSCASLPTMLHARQSAPPSPRAPLWAHLVLQLGIQRRGQPHDADQAHQLR